MKKRLLAAALTFLCWNASLSTVSLAYLSYEEPDTYGFDKNGVTVSKKDYLYYEDFSGYKAGGVPKADITQQTDASISVQEMPLADGTTGKAVVFDNQTSSDSRIEYNIPFQDTSTPLLFETEFKYNQVGEKASSAAAIVFWSGNQQLGRVFAWPNGGFGIQNSDSFIRFTPASHLLTQDCWYTVKVLINPATRMVDVYMQSEAFKANPPADAGRLKYSKEDGTCILKNFSLPDNYDGSPIGRINIQNDTAGKYSFSYFRIKANAELKEANYQTEKIEPPIKGNPMLKPLKNSINIRFAGEYMFFVHPPYEENGVVYAPARNVAGWYGLSYEKNGDAYRFYDSETEVLLKENQAEITLNQASRSMDHKTALKDTVLYLPVQDFVKVMGGSAEYSGAANEVIITKGGN